MLAVGALDALPGPSACGIECFPYLWFVRNHYLEYRKYCCDPSYVTKSCVHKWAGHRVYRVFDGAETKTHRRRRFYVSGRREMLVRK